MKFDIVIAGGGFAGAYCARALGKALGKDGIRRVALIAEQNVLVFQPMLAEVAGSSLTPLDVVNPLRHFAPNVNVLKGSIHKIDWAKRELLLDGGRFTRNHVVGFEHLVLALGAVTDLSRVPGMADYGWPMKSVSDALRLRSALINRLEEANLVDDDSVRRRLLTFVIVGGGYTGVETGGQILDLLHDAKRLFANLQATPLRVVLVHSRAHLLEEIGERLGDYAQRVLEKRGMEVRLNSRVTEVSARRVILNDGSYIDAHTVISTVGSAPHPVVVDLCKQLGIEMKGRLQVEPTMQLPGHKDIWAMGDCAAVPWKDKNEEKTSPPTAQFALRQGTQLARNLLRAQRGQPLQPFTYRYMGQLATVGEHAAVAEVFGFRFSGFIAWWMWRTIYLAKLPGILRKLRVIIDWTFDLFFQRDTSLVAPPPNDLVRSIHLEKGEDLVIRGDKCRGMFVVRRGVLTSTPEAGNPTTLGVDAVIDGDWVDQNGNWKTTLAAAESSDVIVFRGRAYELIKNHLRVTVREDKRPETMPSAMQTAGGTQYTVPAQSAK
jgi:NADH dehydrogenase